ncbi:MAG: hypothetical protein WCK14_13120 [Actinomycetota bacterium]
MHLGGRTATGAAAGVAVLSGAVIAYATRHDPVLSPDSISYLSAAALFRAGRGLTEFSGQPLTVFGPVFPLLLAVGGRSLQWARFVGAACMVGATWLMFVLLRSRVRPWVAVAGAAAFALSPGLVYVGSTVWSENPYIVISLAALAVLTLRPLTERTAALGGLLCALGFLTRYAGAGLIVAGAVCVLAATQQLGLERRQTLRLFMIHIATAVTVCAAWMVRNLVQTGEALGPRFSGGSADSISQLINRVTSAVGALVFGNSASVGVTNNGGTVITVLLVIAFVITLISGTRRVLDFGMAAFALTSLALPAVARHFTASDIEFRVMSPSLIAIVYFAVVVLDRIRWRTVIAVTLVVVVGWSAYEGVAVADRAPHVVAIAAGSRTQTSKLLFDLIDTLPADAHVLTNSPQRVWWQNDRNPTLFAFVRPRAGNSNYPLSAADTLRYACLPHTYLAWFGSLANAGDGPADRRPDLAAIIDLTVAQSVNGGVLYTLRAHDPSQCPAR